MAQFVDENQNAQDNDGGNNGGNQNFPRVVLKGSQKAQPRRCASTSSLRRT
jgi:hypothetical protein